MCLQYLLGENKGGNFGGFIINEFEDFKSSNSKHKGMAPMDDEITNTDTAFNQEIFADKNKLNKEEELP